MKQWSESDLTWYLEILAKNDTNDIAGTLFHNAELGHPYPPEPLPTGNAKIIAYLEKLIEVGEVIF